MSAHDSFSSLIKILISWPTNTFLELQKSLSRVENFHENPLKNKEATELENIKNNN